MQMKSALVIAFAVLLSVGSLCATYLYSARGKRPPDETDRYQLKQYNRGSIVGVALLDKKIGRVWFLREIVDEKGKRVRDEFREEAVSELWETEESIAAGLPGLAEYEGRLSFRIKQLTRPRTVTEANTEAVIESFAQAAKGLPKSSQKPEK